MPDLIPSVNALLDREAAQKGQWVVLYSDPHATVTLSHDDGDWLIFCHPSLMSLGDPQATSLFAWEGTDYCSGALGLAIFRDNTPLEVWERFYEHLTQIVEKQVHLWTEQF